jgi:hypothetical protein
MTIKNRGIIFAVVVGLGLGGAALASGQDFSQYEALKNPRIVTLPDLKMLVVEVKGNPNTEAAQAFGLLFKAYFSLPGAKIMAPPRGRWINLPTDPKGEWLGYLAMPVAPSVTAPPPGSSGVKIEVWKYGEVAEILHIGSYADEPPTVEKLKAFVAEKGYEFAGPHEEEYIKGPTQVASPAEYWTIIRYQVKKKQ